MIETTKDSTSATGPGDELQQQCRARVAYQFNDRWLEASGGSHRIQRLWRRKDLLAKLEIASLGHAMEALEPHRQWLAKAVRTVKVQPNSGHGHLFEIMLLGAMAAGGMQVRPKTASAPGYDAEIVLESGHVLRTSIKNHDLSSHEAAFRKGCEELNVLTRERVRQSGKAWSVRATGDVHLDRAWLRLLIETMRTVPLTGAGGTTRLPQCRLIVSPLAWPRVVPPSYQLVVHSPAHDLEQRNFARKLANAIEDFACHSPRDNGHSNVIFMRVHTTANLIELQEQAKTQLLAPGCVVDAVFFMQTSVVREANGWAVSYYMPMVATDRFDALSARISLSQLAGRAVPRPTRLQVQSSNGLTADVSGHYLYQRGDLYYPWVMDEELTLKSPAAGIRTFAVFRDREGNGLDLEQRISEDDELMIL